MKHHVEHCEGQNGPSSPFFSYYCSSACSKSHSCHMKTWFPKSQGPTNSIAILVFKELPHLHILRRCHFRPGCLAWREQLFHCGEHRVRSAGQDHWSDTVRKATVAGLWHVPNFSKGQLFKVTGPLQLQGQPRSCTLNQVPLVRKRKRVFWGLSGAPWASSLALVFCWDDLGTSWQGQKHMVWCAHSCRCLGPAGNHSPPFLPGWWCSLNRDDHVTGLALVMGAQHTLWRHVFSLSMVPVAATGERPALQATRISRLSATEGIHG